MQFLGLTIAHRQPAPPIGCLSRTAAPSTLATPRTPTILLVHDEAGSADDFHGLSSLLAANCFVTAGLGSGLASHEHELVRLSETADAIVERAHHLGEVEAIVAHGTGAIAAMLALSRERFTRRAVLIAEAPIELDPSLIEDLGDVSVLFVHAQDDTVTPMRSALHTAELWPHAMLAGAGSLGHRRILFAPSTHEQVVRFLELGRIGTVQ